MYVEHTALASPCQRGTLWVAVASALPESEAFAEGATTKQKPNALVAQLSRSQFF